MEMEMITAQKMIEREYAYRASYEYAVLPYGKWTCADGREVLFNRGYKPIWQRLGGCVSAADRNEWVKWEKQEWFYTDFNSPVKCHGASKKKRDETIRRCEAILNAWGVDTIKIRTEAA